MSSQPTRRDLIKLASVTLAMGGIGCKESEAELFPDGGLEADGDVGVDASACSRTGAQTAGPFYPGEPESLMNIIGDRVGVLLTLELTVLESGSCDPIAGAEVDVWTADANGDYSGYVDFDTLNEDWLRGQQLTGSEGTIGVQCIVPGAYPGRAVHVHIKVRAAGRPELTTQLYFPDAMVATVLADPGYQGASQTTNAVDGFYAGDTLLTVSGDVAGGYAAAGTVYV